MKAIIILIIAVLAFSPSLFAAEETPDEGLKSIIKLYETKDFDTLVRERYAELHKAKSEAEVIVLIENFSKRFGNEKMLKFMIEGYNSFLAATPVIETSDTPQISETGKVAKFPTEKGVLKLYMLKTGKWGFHL